MTQSQAQLQYALASLERYRAHILPPLENVLQAVQEQYALGDVSYLPVLDALARLGNARVREIELEADARRALAELERSVGARFEVGALPKEDS